MSLEHIVAVVLAGGEGKRLKPLTSDIPKPLLEFAGEYKIIDFVLSNLYNSGIKRIFTILQDKPQELSNYIQGVWDQEALSDVSVDILEPKYGVFEGTADAVFKNWKKISNAAKSALSRDIAIFGADHVYRMDLNPMFEVHQKTNADLTLVAVEVPKEQAPHLGVIEAEEKHGYLSMKGFGEKPQNDIKTVPGNPDKVLGSMGNYIFKKEVLSDLDSLGLNDFGHDIVPYLLENGYKISIYNFNENIFPGITEGEIGYWIDVGTMGNYFNAHMDICSTTPRLNLFNEDWLIRTGEKKHGGVKGDHLESKLKNYYIPRGAIISGSYLDGVVAAPCVIRSATLRGAVIGNDVEIIGPDVHIENAILDEGCKINPGVHIHPGLPGPWKEIEEGLGIFYNEKLNLYKSNDKIIVPKNAVISQNLFA
ncbi:MAG: sugar phosphate nucleotidyltransferase [Candidatus Woesearchaeota archaeon]